MKIKGLGAKSREKLAKAGVLTFGDLLALLPRDYFDYSRILPIPQAPLEKQVHIRGRVISRELSITKNKRIPVLEILVDDGHGTLRVVWFNQTHIHDRIIKNQTLSLFGKIRYERNGRTMNSPNFEVVAAHANPETGEPQIEPVYREIGGLRSAQINGWVQAAIQQIPREETLPAKVMNHFLFPSHAEAISRIHNPENSVQLDQILKRQDPAWRRLVFEEFFHFHCQRIQAKQQVPSRHYPRLQPHDRERDAFLAKLPFQLTGDQRRVIDQMTAWLRGGKKLNSLIQGDVGCGKTVVGLAMGWFFKLAGWQTVLLCPTVVLADQHYQKAAQLLATLGVRCALLTGKRSRTEIREVLEGLGGGQIDLVIGTHRLLAEDVVFAKLGLVLIDEQQRFGVAQRASLLQKGREPHYLAFSATPIPRSLAMTLFGEVDVLQIRQRPAFQKPVRTALKRAANRDEVVAFARKRLDAGESVFWVFPLIEGEAEDEERSANAMWQRFRENEFAGVSVGLVHGRLDKDRVDTEMTAFKEGRHRVLLATTVIEVGVDVPKATVMVIEGADYFGLSQLHQLRGRVGRGGRQAFCFLMVDGVPDKDQLQRLRFLEKHDDGFEIAEYDLERRGAGEFFGKRQSGVSDFQFGDPWRDRDLMQAARQAALAFLQ
nr:ATP-dependent DNA helicase RecG [Acanthopleuribacter pedis]